MSLSRSVFAVAAILLSSNGAFAGPASDAVRWFYENVGKEAEPESRARFTGAARAYLDANDRAWEEREEVCLDFGMTIDAQDYDEAEIARSLELTESVQGDGAIVMAKFSNFGQRQTLEWTLERDGRMWLVADIMSLQGGWRLSEFSCG